MTLIEGGHSNLTYVIADATSRRWVLRRPPYGEVAATAHDVIREQRLMAALGSTPVPVPRIAGVCQDLDVLGAPFYVMDFVDGVVPRDATTAEQLLDVGARRVAAWSLVDGLAKLHRLDPVEVGLGELSRGTGYIERQLRRWRSQLDDMPEGPPPALVDVHARLAAAVPEQGPSRIVHGDYKLENCIFDLSGNLVAVLDWELCTLGDPLADLGLLLVYWPDPSDPDRPLGEVAALAPGFPTRAELIARYLDAAGLGAGVDVDYYVAFAHWRLACISQGVWSRYASGQMGERGDPTVFRTQADALIASTTRAIAALR
jgi:aminoglycoside phosphotransferase (APT) family kinase protein